MNTKNLVTLLVIFGLLLALAECRRLSKRSYNRRDFDDDNDNEGDNGNDNDNGNDGNGNDGDNDNDNDDGNDNDNDNDGDNDNDNDGDNDNNGGSDLQAEKRAIRNFLQDEDDSDNGLEAEKRTILNFLQDENDASQFLDQSRRLFSDQKSQMKEAKKKYEEKCERLLHPRYCPDLATWPAWNQAFNSASGKK